MYTKTDTVGGGNINQQANKIKAQLKQKLNLIYIWTAAVLVLLSIAFVQYSASNTATAAAGINRQINFQGKLVNPNGTNVTDGTYSVVFSIYTVASAGTAVWSETQSVGVSAGIFQVNLGSVTALPGSVDFNTDNIYLGVKVGADAEMTPRIQFTSVPQAFNSEKLGGLDKTGFIQNTTTQQAATNFNIGGTGVVGTSLTTPLLQSAPATALTITGNAASTWSTSAGNLTIQAAGTNTLNLDTGGAGTVAIGNTATIVNVGNNTAAVTLNLATNNGGNDSVNILTGTGTNTLTVGNATGTTSSQFYGNSTFTQQAGKQLLVTTGTTVPTTDQLAITNAGSTGVTAAGVNGLSINYKGGAAAVESSAQRIDLQPGTTSGGTWSGIRFVAAATGPVAGVTENGAKFEGPTTGGAGTYNGVNVTNLATTTGGTANGVNITATNSQAAGTVNGININSLTGGAATENAINIGTGWDNILQSANFSVSGAGALTATSFTASGTTGLAVSSAGQGRIFYDTGTSTFRVSMNGGAYSNLLTGTTGFTQGGNSFGATATLGTTDANALTLGTYNGTALQQRINITNTANNTTNSTLTFNGASVFRPTADSTAIFQIQNAAGGSFLNADSTNGRLTVTQANLLVTSFATPATPGVAVGSNQGGSLSGATTYYYKVSAISGSGESAGSAEATFAATSFTPLTAPGAATAALDAAAGVLTGDYSYKITYTTANGETIGGTTSNTVTANAQQIDLSGIPTGPTGTTSRKIYRTVSGGATYYLVTTLNDNTTTVYNNDNVDDTTLIANVVVPVTNTARTNTNNTTVTFTAVPGATSYRIYRGTTPGGENAYQSTATSPFTDTGAAGTAATPQASSTNGRLGVGTSTPGYAIDVQSGDINTAGAYRIGGLSTLTSSSLTFNAAAAASIQSATGQQLTIDSGTTGALNFGTGAFAKTITLGNSTGATGITLNSGTNGIAIGTNAVNKTVSLGATSTTANTTTVNIANSTGAAQTVSIGSTNTTSTTTLQGGTGGINLITNSASSGVYIKAQTDTATAFQVQSNSGAPVFNVDTTDTNLLGGLSPGFENNPLTSWTAKNGGSVVRYTTQKYSGNASGLITTTATANSGVQIPYTFAANTQYTLSLYAKRIPAGSINTFAIGRQDVSGTDIDCLTGQSLSQTGYTRFTCTFTTGATITSSNIYVKQTDAVARASAIDIDAMQLQTGAFASAYGAGNLQLSAGVTSSLALQNTTDSTTAFTIQNASSSLNLFTADTLNGRVGIGTANPSQLLDVQGGNINTSGTVTGTQLLSTVATGTAPLAVTSTTLVSNLNVQYLGGYTDSQISALARSGNMMTGGGTVGYNNPGTGVSWSSRFIVISNSRGSDFSTAGYFDITMPVDGTVITGANTANVTVASGAVPIPAWCALYYILPIGSNNTSIDANYRIVCYSGTNLSIPSNWVLVANSNADNTTMRFGNGMVLRSGQTSTAGSVNNAVFNTSVNTPLLQNAGALNISATGANQVNFNTNGSLRWSVLSTGELQGNGASAVQSSTGNITIGSAAGNGNVVLAPNGTGNVNISVGGLQTSGTLRLSSGGALSNITGYTQSSGSATFNQNAADQFKVVALQAPTTDMVNISNAGFPITADAINGQQVDYFSALGNAAFQASAQRLNVTNTSAVAGSITNGLRVVASGAVAGTTNGIKIDGFTAGAGGASALYVGSGWKDILNYNGTQLINGSGIVQSAAISGNYANLTGTGALASGSIANGFGTITTGNTITGTTVNGTTGINTGAAAGTQRIDNSGNLLNIGNITSLGVVSGNNILPYQYSSWEYGANGDTVPNYGLNGAQITSITLSTASAYDGSRALQITSNASGADAYAYLSPTGIVPIRPGAKYALSAYVKDITSAGSTSSVDFFVNFNNAGSTHNAASGTATDTWSRISNTFTAPSDATGFRIRLDINAASRSVLFDALMVEEIPTTQTTASGYSPSLAMPGFSVSSSTGTTPNVTFDGSVNAVGGLTVGTLSVITNARVLQNVTASAAILTSGTLDVARLTGSYTGITGTGALAAGSIASGFGTISTGNTIQGTTLNGTTGINTGAGSGTQRIDSSGNLLNLGYAAYTGMAAPAVSAANSGRLYYDSTSNTFKVSMNGAAYVSLATGAGSTSSFAQGGNSFGATATLGTTDANALTIGTYNGTALQQRINITNTTAAGNNATLTFNGASVFKPTANTTAAFQVQNAAGTSLLNVDTTGNSVSINQAPLNITGLPGTSSIPGKPTVTSASSTGGTLASGKIYYYKVTAVSGAGESVPSNESSLGVMSYLPNPATAPTAVDSGNNPNPFGVSTTCTSCTYVYTYVTAAGTETLPSPASSPAIGTGNTVTVSNIGTGPSGVTARKIYRSDPPTLGDSTYYLAGTIANNTATTYSDSAYFPDTSSPLPTSSNATSSTNTFNISWPSVAGATSYKIYRGTSTNAENILVTTTSSTSYVDTGSGSAATPPSPSVTTPSLQVAGAVWLQASQNSMNTLNIQDANSQALLNADTVNQRISIGAVGTPTGQLYVSGSVPKGFTGSIATGSKPRSVAVQGNYAYVANQGSNTITVYDISDAANPTSVGSLALSYTPSSLTVQGRYLYVAYSNDNSISAIDLANPVSPVIIGTIANSNGYTSQVVTAGGVLYIVYGTGIGSYNISSPAASNYLSGIGINASAVATRGTYVYGIGPDTFFTSNYFATGSTSVTTVNLPAGTNPKAITLAGRYAYIAAAGTNKILVYDINNPTSPVSVGSINTGSSPTALSAQGQRLYVATASTLETYDVSNPANSTLVGSVLTGGASYSISVQGRYVYLVNSDLNTLNTYDIGGAYIQQLETGTIKTSSLQVSTTATFGGNVSIQEALNVSGSALVSGTLSTNAIRVGGSSSAAKISASFDSSKSEVGTYTFASSSGAGINFLADINTQNSTTGFLFVGKSGVSLPGQSGDTEFSVRGDGTVRADGAFYGASYNSGSADVAEYVPSHEAANIEAGDILEVDGTSDTSLVKKSTGVPYATKLAGVVSTQPGVTLGDTQFDNDGEADHSKEVRLALTGRVPVKVTDENGAIQPGDYITSSSTPGYGMKATQPGMTVGRALASFDGDKGTVLILVENTYYNPSVANILQAGNDAAFGDVDISGSAKITNLNVSGNATLKSLRVTGDAAIEGKLTVASIDVGTITISGHIVTKGDAPQLNALPALGAQGSVTIDGNDTAGTITITTGDTGLSAGDLGKVTFKNAFGKSPRIILSAQDQQSQEAQVFPGSKSAGDYMLKTGRVLPAHATYTYDYIVIE